MLCFFHLTHIVYTIRACSVIKLKKKAKGMNELDVRRRRKERIVKLWNLLRRRRNLGTLSTVSNCQRRGGSRQETMEEEPNNSARRLSVEKAKKLRRRVERAEHAAVKGVADGIIGSFLFACSTRPRFSFTSSYEALRITYSFVCVARVG